MKEMKLLATLVCPLAVLAFAATALAQDDEAEVDWDEAIEFADLVDTYVENGTTWETYYDALQGVMWSQPEDVSAEGAKAYLSGDQETLKDLGLDDICFVNWPIPDYLQFSDDEDDYEYYNADFDLYLTGSNYKKWLANIGTGIYDVDDSLIARVRNTTSYCGDYENRFYIPPYTYSYVPDSQGCTTFLGITYYALYEAEHVENWDYDSGNIYVSKHKFYACGSYHYVYLMVGAGPE